MLANLILVLCQFVCQVVVVIILHYQNGNKNDEKMKALIQMKKKKHS